MPRLLPHYFKHPAIPSPKVDVTTTESLPSRSSGIKRAAISSPVISPPCENLNLTATTTASSVHQESGTKMQPLRLVDKFPAPHKKRMASHTTHESSTQHENLIDGMDPTIIADILRDLDPPTPGEVLPYDFDEDNVYTAKSIKELNGLKLEEALRCKATKCKQ